MTQTQMTAHLADKIGITKKQAKSALDELNELMVKHDGTASRVTASVILSREGWHWPAQDERALAEEAV